MTAQTANWREAAACKDASPDAFFPEHGETGREAKAVCAGCKVVEPCLAYALAHRATGIWGNTSDEERRHLTRPPLPATPPCGTPNGYKAHRRRGEDACAACREAHAANNRAADATSTRYCGTARGWRRHNSAGEQPCTRCAVWFDSYGWAMPRRLVAV